MDDPVYTNRFINEIIEARKRDIVGLAIAKGNRLTLQKNKSKYEYIISLLLIMGFYHFFKNSIITLGYNIKKILHLKLSTIFNDPTIKGIAEKHGIRTWQIKNPNNKEFLSDLRKLNIDVIIHQSQNILKSALISIPKIGIINRHNALLPKNRGRLTPFWVLYKEEKKTGVSIHFVTEALDAGDIIVQKSFVVKKNDNFNTIVKKNYQIAPFAILEALDKLENGDTEFKKNDDLLASYNSTPTLKEAWIYRKKRIFRSLNVFVFNKHC